MSSEQPGRPFEVGNAVLHYSDGREVRREIPLLNGRAPGQFDLPVTIGRYERFELRGWEGDVIHYEHQGTVEI